MCLFLIIFSLVIVWVIDSSFLKTNGNQRSLPAVWLRCGSVTAYPAWSIIKPCLALIAPINCLCPNEFQLKLPKGTRAYYTTSS